MPPSDFGTRTLPSQTFPEVVGRVRRPLASPGGARGPLPLPSRLIRPETPAPPDARSPLGQSGERNLRNAGTYPFGAVGGPDAAIPRLMLMFWHSVRWARGWYQNDAGYNRYTPPTPMPNWTADGTSWLAGRKVAGATFRRWIGTWSTKRDYHQDAIRFPLGLAYGSPGAPREATSATLKRMRSAATPRIQGGRPFQLTRWGRAPSYGSQTVTLATAPAGQNPSDYGGSY